MIAAGNVIRARGLGKPNRPGIVLRVFEEGGIFYAMIAFGSKSVPLPTEAQVFVDQHHPYYGHLGLESPTYFTGSSSERLQVTNDSIELVQQYCPPLFFGAIRKLYGFR